MTGLILLIFLAASGCTERVEEPPITWHSPVLDSLVRYYHTARSDIKAGDIDRAMPYIDSIYIAQLDKRANALRISGREFLRRAVWDWPVLSAGRLQEVETDKGYIRLSFITDTLQLSRGIRGQATSFVLFRYDDRWRVAGVTRIVKPLADPYGYGYPQHVLETDLPSYMRFPRQF